MEPKPRTPTALDLVRTQYSKLQDEFDGHCVIVMRELASLRDEVAQLRAAKEDRDSQAQFSWQPGRARANLTGFPPWAVVAIVLIVSAALTVTCGRQSPPGETGAKSGVEALVRSRTPPKP